MKHIMKLHLNLKNKTFQRTSVVEKQDHLKIIQRSCIKYSSNGKYCTEHEIVIRHLESLTYRN